MTAFRNCLIFVKRLRYLPVIPNMQRKHIILFNKTWKKASTITSSHTIILFLHIPLCTMQYLHINEKRQEKINQDKSMLNVIFHHKGEKYTSASTSLKRKFRKKKMANHSSLVSLVFQYISSSKKKPANT